MRAADPTRPEHVVRCSAKARTVMGIIADGTSSFLINAYGGSPDAALTGKPLVLAGRVPVKVSLENGPITMGDLLTPSSVPGVAMRSTGAGPIVGVALGRFTQRTSGTVLCFVSAREGNISAEVEALRHENAVLRERLNRVERLMEKLVAER